MKMLMFHLTILYFLTLTGCNEDKESPTEPLADDPPAKVVITVSENSALVSEGIVIIENDTLYTNEQGIVNFTNLENGTYHIIFIHPEFDAIDTTFTFQGDTLKLKPTRTFYDYFPLKIGNTWIYDYTYISSSLSSSSDRFNIIAGSTIKWEITDAQFTDNHILYSLRETYNLLMEKRGIKKDTIITSVFSIKVYSNNYVEFAERKSLSLDSTSNYSLFPSNGFKFMRYFPISSSQTQTIDFTNINGGIILDKKVGIKRLSAGFSSKHFYWYTDYTLKNYMIK